ncbi:hypothetical protein GZH46_00532, partial [Fragariocoptes setiger]
MKTTKLFLVLASLAAVQFSSAFESLRVSGLGSVEGIEQANDQIQEESSVRAVKQPNVTPVSRKSTPLQPIANSPVTATSSKNIKKKQNRNKKPTNNISNENQEVQQAATQAQASHASDKLQNSATGDDEQADLSVAASKHKGHHYGKYYMFTEVPKKGAYKMGFKRGNKKHTIERKESVHKSHVHGSNSNRITKQHQQWTRDKGDHRIRLHKTKINS